MPTVTGTMGAKVQIPFLCLLAQCGGPKGPPKDVHTIIPGTCEDVMLHGNRAFAEAIKVTELKTGRLPWIFLVGLI